MSLIPFFTGLDDAFFAPSPMMSDVLARGTLLPENDQMLRRSSPFYEVTENDTQYQIAMDVPGVPRENINISLEHDGRVLKVSGGRKVRKKGENGSNAYFSETKFEKQFTLGSNIDASKLAANLQDGVLVLTAPKKETRKVTRIAISDGPPPELIEDKKPDTMKE